MSRWTTLLLASFAWWGGAILYAFRWVTVAAESPLTGDGYEREHWFLSLVFAFTHGPFLLAGYLLLAAALFMRPGRLK